MAKSSVYQPDREGGDGGLLSTGGYASPGAGVDSFGRQRVGNPVTLFSHHFHYEIPNEIWVEKIVGVASSSYLPNESSYELSIGTDSGDKIIRQTRQYFPYQPGKSHFAILTGLLGPTKTNVRSAIGYFDDSNGIFFEKDENGISVVLRSSVTGSVVDDKVLQTDWNQDKLDGNGPSGINLQTDKSQIFLTDLQWLGEGRVRVGVDIGGNVIYVHQYTFANEIDSTYMEGACLPCRYELENVGPTGSASTMKQVCSTVVSEGGYDLGGTPRIITTGNVPIGITPSTWIPILSIRPKSTYFSKINRVMIAKLSHQVMSDNKSSEYAILFNSALTGASWLDVSVNSAMQYDVSASAYSGGDIVGGGYIPAGTGQRGADVRDEFARAQNIPLGLDIDGLNPTSMTIIMRAIAANSDVHASFDWREYI